MKQIRNSIAISFSYWFFFYNPVKVILPMGRNFTRWAWKYFSIGYFLPRLFAPWHRDLTGYGRGFDIKRFFHVFGWNMISRVIGAVLRLFVILVGLVVEVCFFSLTLFLFVFWYALPVIVAVLIGYAMAIIF